MDFESGNRVPLIQRMGYFPFVISEDLSGVYNIQNYNGPIEYDGPISPEPMFSGCLGNGTYYPSSGSLDQLLRLFWGVKAWTIQINSSSLNSQTVSCGGLPFVLTYSLDTFITKNLILQDYWSYYNTTGEFTSLVDNGSTTNFPNNGTCVPNNPIQKFEDLHCRKEYFTWMPDTGSISQFVPRTQGLFTGVRTPYSTRFNIFRQVSPYDNQCYASTYSQVQSIFGLSIMSPDFLTYSGMIGQTGDSYFVEPTVDSGNYNNFLGSQWVSGDFLTNQWGEITGYNKPTLKASGNIPLVYYKEYINKDDPTLSQEEKDKYIEKLNPEIPNNYFPLIYFYMKVANNEQVTSTFNFPVNEFISTRAPSRTSKRVGTLSIRDGNGNIPSGSQTTIFSCPLYGSSINPVMNANVILTPTAYWLTTSGTINY